jgi:hypothetical protein
LRILGRRWLLIRSEIVRKIAACGLDCGRCAMSADGEIADGARRLARLLEGFEKLAAQAAGRDPAFEGYPGFKAVLERLAGASCPGCRAGGMPVPFCSARTCAPGRGIDFCFECEDYPCKRNEYPPRLAASWRRCNDRMREIGVEAFYDEQLGTPRYQSQEE